MRKIVSGQSFLYRKNGYDSTIIEVKMKDKIRGDYLQVALSNALKRFPYLSDKLVEKKGCYYLSEDLNAMTVNKTNKLYTLGSMSTGYHLLNVTFTDKSIKIAFHHGLCDGRGIKPFIETLIYYYCSLKYKKEFDSTGIHLMDEEIKKEELGEPYPKEFYEVDKSKVKEFDKNCFSLPENTEDVSQTYRTLILVNEDNFIKIAKKMSATPTILTSILFSKAIIENNKIDKPIMCNLAVDLRSFIGAELTHKNCTGTICLPFNLEDNEKNITDLVNKYREEIKTQRDVNFIKNFLNKQIGMFNKLDEIPTLAEKRKMLSFFDNITNDTYVISYLGKMNFNDFDEYIDSVCFYSDGSRGIIINIVAAGGKLSFNVLQNFETKKYVESFCELLKEYDIDYEINDVGVFKTGKDKSYITASHQAERFFK